MKRTSKSQSKTPVTPSVDLPLKSEVLVKPIDTQSVSLTPSVDEHQPVKKTTKKSSPKDLVSVVAPILESVAQQPIQVKLETLEHTGITIETLDAELLNVDDFETKCTEFYAKLQELTSSISTIRSEFKSIEKIWAKKIKTATKTSGKKKKKSGNRAPSGFVKPTKISDELALFLNKPTGTEMARTEVTREINLYIRANQLQDTTNGRKINADKKLSELLKLPSEDELTYFNLQKYMSVHFPKTPVLVPVPVVV